MPSLTFAHLQDAEHRERERARQQGLSKGRRKRRERSGQVVDQDAEEEEGLLHQHVGGGQGQAGPAGKDFRGLFV